MKRSEAIALFDGSCTKLANAVGLTPGRISQWQENLDRRQVDMVVTAALRQKRITCKKALDILGVDGEPSCLDGGAQDVA